MTRLYSRSYDLVRVGQCDGDEFRTPACQDVLHIRLRPTGTISIKPPAVRSTLDRWYVSRLTNFSSPLPQTLPSRSMALRLTAARLVLISSYVANCIDPFDTPTRAKREPR